MTVLSGVYIVYWESLYLITRIIALFSRNISYKGIKLAIDVGITTFLGSDLAASISDGFIGVENILMRANTFWVRRKNLIWWRRISIMIRIIIIISTSLWIKSAFIICICFPNWKNFTPISILNTFDLTWCICIINVFI